MFTSSTHWPAGLRSSGARKGVGCAALATAVAAVSLNLATPANAATRSVTVPSACGSAFAGTKLNVPNNWRALAIEKAFTYCGVNYEWGGTNKNGIDCSGLVMAAYKVNGKNPFKIHRANTQIRTSGLSLRDAGDGNGSGGKAAPGDLVAFSSDGGGFYHHIGIYLGWSPKHEGRRLFVHAPSSGKKVQVSLVWTGEREIYKNPDSLMD
jgi:cell wall-associated NlpC family hydrolase